MIQVSDKTKCCGCTACYAICPKEAISMVEDEEGFEYPEIDESKCIRCFQCIKVCPFKVKGQKIVETIGRNPAFSSDQSLRLK